MSEKTGIVKAFLNFFANNELESFILTISIAVSIIGIAGSICYAIIKYLPLILEVIK